MDVNFVTSRKGLSVKFTTIPHIPFNHRVEWDFGDSSEISIEHQPVHIYEQSGFYRVTMKIFDVNNNVTSVTCETVAASDSSKTSLSGSIYVLIDTLIPELYIKGFTFHKKRFYIEKWQLFLQPLVNHEVDALDFNNELCYEALENQLIMELAIYDFLVATISHYIQGYAYIGEGETTVSEEEDTGEETPVVPPSLEPAKQKVKKIVTGPSEVEFFEDAIDTADTPETMSNVIKSIQSDGILDVLKTNICALADRLSIYIPLCSKDYLNVIPTVARGNKKRPLRGPNPRYPID